MIRNDFTPAQQELIKKYDAKKSRFKSFLRNCFWCLSILCLVGSFGYTHFFEAPEIARNFANAFMILFFVLDLIVLPFYLVIALILSIAVLPLINSQSRSSELKRHQAMMSFYTLTSLKLTLWFWVYLILDLLIAAVLIAAGGVWMFMGVIYLVSNTIQKWGGSKIRKSIRTYIRTLTPEQIKDFEAPKHESVAPFSLN